MGVGNLTHLIIGQMVLGVETLRMWVNGCASIVMEGVDSRNGVKMGTGGKKTVYCEVLLHQRKWTLLKMGTVHGTLDNQNSDQIKKNEIQEHFLTESSAHLVWILDDEAFQYLEILHLHSCYQCFCNH